MRVLNARSEANEEILPQLGLLMVREYALVLAGRIGWCRRMRRNIQMGPIDINTKKLRLLRHDLLYQPLTAPLQCFLRDIRAVQQQRHKIKNQQARLSDKIYPLVRMNIFVCLFNKLDLYLDLLLSDSRTQMKILLLFPSLQQKYRGFYSTINLLLLLRCSILCTRCLVVRSPSYVFVLRPQLEILKQQQTYKTNKLIIIGLCKDFLSLRLFIKNEVKYILAYKKKKICFSAVINVSIRNKEEMKQKIKSHKIIKINMQIKKQQCRRVLNFGVNSILIIFNNIFQQFCNFLVMTQNQIQSDIHLGDIGDQEIAKRNIDSIEQKWFWQVKLLHITINQLQSTNQKGQQEMKREDLQDQWEQSNISKEQENIYDKMYKELNDSNQFSKKFINELGPLEETPVSEYLLNYCNQLRFSPKNIKFILKLLDLRINKMIKNNKIKINWSKDDLHLLVWMLSKYMEKNAINLHQLMTNDDWLYISKLIPGSTPKNCMFKFISLRKFKLSHHKWQKEEEALFIQIIDQFGIYDWKSIAEKLYQRNFQKKYFRTAKQCREHWCCYINPSIKKGPWEKEEDLKLFDRVLKGKCSNKWSLIKEDFQGRTQNALKNRYNLLIEKQKLLNPSINQIDILINILKQKESRQIKISERTDEQARYTSQPTIPFFVPPQQYQVQTPVINTNYIILINNIGIMAPEMSIPYSNCWYYNV